AVRSGGDSHSWGCGGKRRAARSVQLQGGCQAEAAAQAVTMAWIKRNLYFLVGGAVALALMGLAGFYLYSKWQLNNEILEKLQADFAELDRLSKENPHPGDGKKVDNIAEAKNQQKELRDYIEKGKRYFVRIPPIPDVPKVTDHELSTSLSHT